MCAYKSRRLIRRTPEVRLAAMSLLRSRFVSTLLESPNGKSPPWINLDYKNTVVLVKVLTITGRIITDPVDYV